VYSIRPESINGSSDVEARACVSNFAPKLPSIVDRGALYARLAEAVLPYLIYNASIDSLRAAFMLVRTFRFFVVPRDLLTKAKGFDLPL